MEIQNLTDDELTLKVAETCGWTGIKTGGLSIWTGSRPGFKPLHGIRDCVPKYATSLDACATFEATITTGEQWEAYYSALDEESEREDNDPRSATPRQRCIAFLRMKGVL